MNDIEKDTKKINCDYTNEITCPWCGYEFRDSWAESPNDESIGLIECPECEKQFYAERNISINYSTHKANYGKCPKCGKENVAIEGYNSIPIGSFQPMCLDCGEVERRRLLKKYWEQHW